MNQSSNLGYYLIQVTCLIELGTKKSKYFVVIDLTPDIHQIARTPSASKAYVFITFNGLSDYTRLPFGKKGGPIWFLETVARIV